MAEVKETSEVATGSSGAVNTMQEVQQDFFGECLRLSAVEPGTTRRRASTLSTPGGTWREVSTGTNTPVGMVSGGVTGPGSEVQLAINAVTHWGGGNPGQWSRMEEYNFSWRLT